MKHILANLDDILVFLALISFVIASYMVGAILGTYILGVAFLVAAYFAGMALQSPTVQNILSRFQKKR
jgi:hypothetical protein